MSSAHDHQLDDLVALGDLILDLEPKVPEGAPEVLHRPPDALRTSRLLWVRRLVVHEIAVDELAASSRSPFA